VAEFEMKKISFVPFKLWYLQSSPLKVIHSITFCRSDVKNFEGELGPVPICFQVFNKIRRKVRRPWT
jgi:hypothetical protein